VITSERGSGSILVIAILAATLTLLSLFVPLVAVLVTRHSIATAADASALAAADVASGLLPGYPCEAATLVAASNRADITRCDIDAAVVTVTVSTVVLGFRVAITATAGPPGT
jgi:secretion/DNA translocation related TadE-like protein